MLWGVFFGVLLVLEKFSLLKRLQRAPAVVRRIYTLACAAVGWVIFAFEDFAKGFAYLKVMFAGAVFCNSGGRIFAAKWARFGAKSGQSTTGERFFERVLKPREGWKAFPGFCGWKF